MMYVSSGRHMTISLKQILSWCNPML